MSIARNMMPRKSYHRPPRLDSQKRPDGGAWERRPQLVRDARSRARLRMLAYFANQARREMLS